MINRLRHKLWPVWRIIRAAVMDWLTHDAFAQAAAISFFTLFSLAPLLVIAVAVAGLVFGRDAVRDEIVLQFSDLLGRQGGEFIGTVIDNARDPEQGLLASIVGIATLLIASSGAFAQLRAALNQIWEVKPKPGQGIRVFIRSRIVSFSLAIALAFLLLLSLAVSAALAAMGRWVGGLLPGEYFLLRAGNFAVAFAIVTLLFAAIYKTLPDARIGWRETWIGAIVTAGLFSIGKYIIGVYLGQSAPGTIYGAAGSLAIVLFWMYYTSLIFLLGAEITHQHAVHIGKHNPPKPEAEIAPDVKKRVPEARDATRV
jgi:membrane protein